MHCPFCRHEDSRVVDSRTADDGTAVRRRRQCTSCERRFTTVETASLAVTKRSGATEPFSREKVLVGVRKACQGRPVSEDDLQRLAQRVEETIRSSGAAEIDAHEVGLAVLSPLRAIDEVAYLRFASVYRSYDSLEDFEAEIALLRAEHSLDAVQAGDSDTPMPLASEDVVAIGHTSSDATPAEAVPAGRGSRTSEDARAIGHTSSDATPRPAPAAVRPAARPAVRPTESPPQTAAPPG